MAQEWTGPIALAPKEIRHRFLSDGVRRLAFGTSALMSSSSRHNNQQNELENRDSNSSFGQAIKPEDSTVSIPLGNNSIHSMTAEEDGEYHNRRRSTTSNTKNNKSSEFLVDESPIGLLAASWSEKCAGVTGNEATSSMDLLKMRSELSSSSPLHHQHHQHQEDETRQQQKQDDATFLQSTDSFDDRQVFHRWNDDDLTAQTMLVDHTDRPIQKKVTPRSPSSTLRSDDDGNIAAIGGGVVASSSVSRQKLQQSPQRTRSSLHRGTSSRMTSRASSSARGGSGLLLGRTVQRLVQKEDGAIQFTTVQDPLQSFLFMRLSKLPFQISSAPTRRKLVLEADRALYGKNAGSEFLLGPEAAAARDKARDQERLADPTFGFVEGIEFIDSDEDYDATDRRYDDDYDPFNMSFGDVPSPSPSSSPAGGNNRRRRSSAGAASDFGDDFGRSASNSRRGSTMSIGGGGGIGGGSRRRRASAASQAGEGGGNQNRGDTKIGNALVDAAWIKGQKRLMTTGVLFGLDSVFGERKAGDKSYERSSRIRSLFLGNTHLNDLVSHCVATCFGSIRACLGADDVIVPLAPTLAEWPQLAKQEATAEQQKRTSSTSASASASASQSAASSRAGSAGSSRRKNKTANKTANNDETSASHDTAAAFAGVDVDNIGNQSFGISLLRKDGMSDADIQRQADHEALVHALEQRFGLGTAEANPIQAACDRAGLWVSMSQPRASAAPAHINITQRVSTYVSADKRKDPVIGFEVPPEDDFNQRPRRDCLQHLAESFASTLRSFLDKARNPHFFREASQALPQVVALASCRIFDDLRSRSFKESAKLRKREVLQRLANMSSSSSAAAATAKQEEDSSTDDANTKKQNPTNNNNGGGGGGGVGGKFMSASDLNRQLREHWETSTKQVHKLLMQCRRELVFLLSGVDTFKPVYRPRAGEELVPPKQVSVATGDQAPPALDANERGAATTTRTTVTSSSTGVSTTTTTTRSLVPPWANGLQVVKRHPRLQWVLKLSDSEVDTKSETFSKQTKSSSVQSQQLVKKATAPTSSSSSIAATINTLNTQKQRDQQPISSNNNLPPNDASSSPPGSPSSGGGSPSSATNIIQTPSSKFASLKSELSRREAALIINKQKTLSSGPSSPPLSSSSRGARSSRGTSSTSPSRKSSSPSAATAGGGGGRVMAIDGEVGIDAQQQATNTNKEVDADDDEDRFKKAVEFVANAPILSTGSHSGISESLAGVKRLRTPLLSWQRCEDGTTTVQKCDVATLKRTVAKDRAKAGQKSSGNEMDDSGLTSNQNSFAGASFLRDRSDSMFGGAASSTSFRDMSQGSFSAGSRRMSTMSAQQGDRSSFYGHGGGVDTSLAGSPGSMLNMSASATLDRSGKFGAVIFEAAAPSSILKRHHPSHNNDDQQQSYHCSPSPNAPPTVIQQQANTTPDDDDFLNTTTMTLNVLGATTTLTNAPSPTPQHVAPSAARPKKKVAFGALPPAKSVRKKLYGETWDLQPRQLRYALRGILHDVTTNASELYAAAVEAAADSKSMQRQRSDLKAVRQQQSLGTRIESEPVTVVADGIVRQYQKVRAKVRDEEAKKEEEARVAEKRKQKWAARQLERQFGTEEGILSVDGGQKFAIATRDDDVDDDDNEEEDLYAKKPSVWDEVEEPHPLLALPHQHHHIVGSGSGSGSTSGGGAETTTGDGTSTNNDQEKNKDQQQTKATSSTLPRHSTPILHGVISSVPASRAALVHAYAQGRADCFSKSGDRMTAISQEATNVTVGLRSSVDARRVETAIKRLEDKKQQEEAARIQRGQAESLTARSRKGLLIPKPPPSSISSSSSFSRAPGNNSDNVGPWYAQGLPKHRMATMEQRDNPWGTFKLGQGSPLLCVGMHSSSTLRGGTGGEEESTTTHGYGNRREVKWTLS